MRYGLGRFGAPGPFGFLPMSNDGTRIWNGDQI
jgi:hypothetical protein